MIENLYKTKTGRYIISVILGLGISALFRKVCNDRDCLIVKGPPSNEIVGSIYEFDDKCFKYRVKNTSCKHKK
mgnify:FL=1|jgi:hypothetical protein|tara:strand:- start:776 stop:994 length:219 start_codon:yes stop_codon:yes gene_type:complete